MLSISRLHCSRVELRWGDANPILQLFAAGLEDNPAEVLSFQPRVCRLMAPLEQQAPPRELGQAIGVEYLWLPMYRGRCLVIK